MPIPKTIKITNDQYKSTDIIKNNHPTLIRQDKYGLVYQGPISTVPGSIGINWGAYQNTVGQISSDPGVGASPPRIVTGKQIGRAHV